MFILNNKSNYKFQQEYNYVLIVFAISFLVFIYHPELPNIFKRIGMYFILFFFFMHHATYEFCSLVIVRHIVVIKYKESMFL